MRPMIKRISDKRGHRRAISLKFIVVRSVACDKSFAYSAGTHSSPFVVVSSEPKLGYVFITLVRSYIGGIYMTMVVDYRQIRRICVIKHLRHVRIKQKIVVHKFIHSRSPIKIFFFPPHGGFQNKLYNKIFTNAIKYYII